MMLKSIPCELFTLSADNGDPLLLYGTDGVNLFCWPTEHIAAHRFAFARWSRGMVERYRGMRLHLQHQPCDPTRRWMEWLGVKGATV